MGLEPRLRARRAIRLVAFDLDGTLIPGTSVARHLLAGLGKKAEADAMERLYLSGAIDQREAARRSGLAFSGVPISRMERNLAALPLIAGLSATLDALSRAGAIAIIATVTWTFAVRYFAGRFGFKAYSGTVMREIEGRLTGRVARYCSEAQKRDFVMAYARRHGIPMTAVAAVGDARSDLPLFGVAGLAIALNASPEAKAAAHIAVDTDDLQALLPLLGIPVIH